MIMPATAKFLTASLQIEPSDVQGAIKAADRAGLAYRDLTADDRPATINSFCGLLFAGSAG